MSEKKKTASKIYNWTFLAIVIGAVVLVNIISSFVYKRYDMTADQRFSLSQGTVEFLKNTSNLKSRLNIKIYLDGNLPAELNHFRNAIEDKLKEFKQLAGDRIEYQFINPNVGTDQEQQELHQNIWSNGQGILPMDIVYMKDGTQSKMMLWPGAIIEYAGSTVNTLQFLPGSKTETPYQLKGLTSVIENAINNLEYMLISSLRRVTQESKPRIAFIQGHGELKYQETQRIRALISPYFAITDVTLNDSIHALDNVDGVVIARPTTKYSDKDLYIIDQYLMKGGKLMCFLDQLYLPEDSLEKNFKTHTIRYETGIEQMVFDYGLKANDNYVIDARCVPKQVSMAKQTVLPWFFHVLATATDHPISRNVEPVALKYTSEIQFVGQNPDVVLTPILTSSSNSSVTGLAPMVSLSMPLNYGENPELVPNPESESNKKCIAGLAEGMFESYFKNRIVSDFTENKDSGYLNKSTKEGKVLLIGNGRFIANQYDSMMNQFGTEYMYRPKQMNDLQYDEGLIKLRMPHFFGNQEFFQNLTDYMMGDNSVLDIRSRQIDIREINTEKVKSSAQFYKIVNMGLPILLILLLAFTMNFLRKRKFTH